MIIGWNIFPVVAAIVVLLATTGAVVALRRKERSPLALGFMVTAIVVMLGFIAMLWMTLERPPLRTMGETRLWYSFFLLVAGAFTYARWRYRWIMSFSTILATVFILINILKPEIHDQGLMPALQSIWFVPHVSVYMFSYALLGCATLLAIVALATRRNDLNEAIERLLYGGIAFLSIGMLTGSLWAKEAWGAYWSWDAKEAWAAVTWGLYLLALHVVPTTAKGDNKAFYIVIILGFLALQMCWYGVNYLPSAAESVHTYNQ
ncbi:MAG: cytochrome c biogenesis protein CcsA [Alistipes sp.]|nr:cytochrome c biogenesis protein CcsA [Alistipes sp.]MBR3827625.1 cytochrome c biogenesis protein CcsA [Alistipes sp.]